MPGLEHQTISDRTQQSHQMAANSLHNEVIEARKTGNLNPQQQVSNALDAFGQFSIGFGDGLAHFTTETLNAAGKAITHPTDTINHAINDTKKTVGGAVEATKAGSQYLATKISHGDVAGMTNDAIHTGQALGTMASQSIDHFNHLSAKEKGYIVGHDVAPTVVGTIVAPELIPEGALAAGAAKVMSVAGTLIKEEGALAKVATTFEAAREHVSSISEKMATLNQKMEALLHKEKSVVHAMEDAEGVRLRKGTIAHGEKPSSEFKEALNAVPLSPGEKRFISSYNVQIEPVHNMGAALGERHVFAMGTYKDGMNVIKIAEKTGFAEDLVANGDVAHSLHHEIGHAVNYWLGDRTGRPFQYVSDQAHFVAQFEADLAKNTDATRTAQAILKHLCGDDVKLQMDETFAVMFGHISCPSNTQYANQMREAFDGYYKLVDAFRKEHGI